MAQEYPEQTEPTTSSPVLASKISTYSLDLEESSVSERKISVCSHAQRGSGVSKYTVYTIVGSDRNGAFEAVRRYNEFDQLRKCLLENWPGCFIPALPDKKPLHKNEPQVIENRRRWLNHFMKKIATQEYLYYSEEFQFFLRSTDADVRPAFDKWVRPSIDLLIKKYRQHFGEIEKKEQINAISVKVSSFMGVLKKALIPLASCKEMSKNTALARDQYNKRISAVFSRILPQYEKVCLYEYVNGDEKMMVFVGPAKEGFEVTAKAIHEQTKENPYWLVYDIVKLEQRDAQAFLEALAVREKYFSMADQKQHKIHENRRQIEDISMGGSTLKTVFTRSSKEQVKTKIQFENKSLDVEKNDLLTLCQLITIMQYNFITKVYIESRRNFYTQSMDKSLRFEISLVEKMDEHWKKCEEISKELLYSVIPIEEKELLEKALLEKQLQEKAELERKNMEKQLLQQAELTQQEQEPLPIIIPENRLEDEVREEITLHHLHEDERTYEHQERKDDREERRIIEESYD